MVPGYVLHATTRKHFLFVQRFLASSPCIRRYNIEPSIAHLPDCPVLFLRSCMVPRYVLSSSSLGILLSRMVPTYFSLPACASGPGVSLLLLSRLCAPFVFVFVLLFCFRSFLVFAPGHPNPCRRRKLFPSFLGRYCAADGVFGPAFVFAAVVLNSTQLKI